MQVYPCLDQHNRQWPETLLDIREQALGSDDPHVVETLTDYALLLQKTGREAEADTTIARARAMRTA